MTKVIFKRFKEKLISFEVKGHAGYDDGDYNYDMVCCGISAISITIVNGITEVLKINAFYEMKDGFLSLDLSKVNATDIEKCQVLMETMLIGLKNMEINYGKYISVEVEEV